MGLTDIFKEKKTISEIKEQEDQVKAENELLLSEIQHKQLKKKLSENGLSMNNFGGSLSSAWKWFKQH